jgi:hypothetical protein
MSETKIRRRSAVRSRAASLHPPAERLRRSERIRPRLLDRDLVGPSFGEDVAEFLAAERFVGHVIIYSANPFGAEMILRVLSEARIKAEIVPFTMLGLIRVPSPYNYTEY